MYLGGLFQERRAARDTVHLHQISSSSRVELTEQSVQESGDDSSREKHENAVQVNETGSSHEEPMEEKL